MSNKPQGIGPAKQSPIGIKVDSPPLPVEAVKQAAALDGPKHDDKGAGDIPSALVFDLDYLDRRGRRWQGRFRSHILTIRERMQVGLVRARLAGGLPPMALDAATVDILEMQAHLAVALDQAPEWAATLQDVRDVNVLGAIYKEVASHEVRFWGADAGGSGGGTDARPEGDDGKGVAQADGPPGSGS
jgi:hypothetical protein